MNMNFLVMHIDDEACVLLFFLFIAFIVCHSLPRLCAFDKTCEKGPLRVKLAMFFNFTVFIWSRNPVMCMVDVFMISPWCIPSGWRTISIIVCTWEICRWRRWSRFATLGGPFVDQKLFFEAQFPMGHQETFPRLSVFFYVEVGTPKLAGNTFCLNTSHGIPWSTNHFPSAAAEVMKLTLFLLLASWRPKN